MFDKVMLYTPFYGTHMHDFWIWHVYEGSYLGRTEPNSGMEACRFPVICHAGNDQKLPVMSLTRAESTRNHDHMTRNALLVCIGCPKKRVFVPYYLFMGHSIVCVYSLVYSL